MVRAEFLKARTTRTALALVLGAVVVTALATASMVLSQRPETLEQTLLEQQFYFIGAIIVATFSLVLGARSFADEFRYGSIVPTFTTAPVRARVLAAKMVSSSVLGAVLATVSLVGMVLIGFVLSPIKGASFGLSSGDVTGSLRLVVAGALWAALGVGLGAAVRNQIASIVGVVVWILVLENVVSGLAAGAATVLPGQAGYGFAGAVQATQAPSPVAGAAILVSYVIAAALLGVTLLRRDVSAL